MPLHIFEPRYRKMVGEAAAEAGEFGIVAAHGQTIEVVGCTAVPEEITHRYEDGRFDVVSSRIVSPNSNEEYRLEWRVIETEGGKKIVDIVI